MSDVLLALDLGTNLGWACGRPDAMVSGSVDLKPTRFESSGVRYLKFVAFLDKLHLSMNIGHVTVEAVHGHRGVAAAHVYGGFLAHMQTWCLARGISYSAHGVQAIKKHSTGKGNASKKDVIEAMKAKGLNPADDDEADAMALFMLEVEGRALQ